MQAQTTQAARNEEVANIKDAFRQDDIMPFFFGNHVQVRYNGIDIVTFDDKEIILDSKGQRTKPLKSKINQACAFHGLNVHVFERNSTWLCETPEGPTVLFEDGMRLKRVPTIGPISKRPTDRLDKAQANQLVDHLWNVVPTITVGNQDAKHTLLGHELKQEKKRRSGKKAPAGFSDAQAAKFLAVKHLWDACNDTKYTAENILQPELLPNLFAQGMVECAPEDFKKFKQMAQQQNFKALSYADLMK